MKTKFALLLVFCAISLNIFAQEKKIKDRRTNPERKHSINSPFHSKNVILLL